VPLSTAGSSCRCTRSTAAARDRRTLKQASSRTGEFAQAREGKSFAGRLPCDQAPGKRTGPTDLLPCVEGPKARQAYALRSPAADGKSHPAGTGRAVRASSKRELSPAGAIVPAGRNSVAIIGSVPEALSARARGDEGP